MDLSKTWNADYIEGRYQQWMEDPRSVSDDWRFFFEGFELAGTAVCTPEDAADPEYALKQSRVLALIHRYRELGHILACLDPLTACPTDHPLLNLSAFHLTQEDVDTRFHTHFFSQGEPLPLRDVIQSLKETYCRSIGVEYMHLQDPDERRWLQDRMEPVRNQPRLDSPARIRILELLCRAAGFEAFLHTKYIAQTRFSIEGAEVIVPMLDHLLSQAAAGGCREIILGTAHRGRLNIQAHILGKPYEEIFDEFNSCYNPDGLFGAGDVKYHNGYMTDIEIAGDRMLRLFLVNNPSHLESVDPVVEGIARARQDITAEGQRSRVMPVLIHGDAAFAGQGIVAETLNMSQLAGYKTGGTIHVVINNQIGYTTLPEHARSTRYSTDVAKMLMVPIFHVHGENPEAVLHTVQLANEYRMNFSKDVVIDVVCYRRYGHNEGDDPYFTQPLMYDRIKDRPPLYKLYARTLIDDGVMVDADLDLLESAAQKRIEDAFVASQQAACPFPVSRFYENWKGFHGNHTHTPEPTGVAPDRLLAMARAMNTLPENFTINPKLNRILKKRLQQLESGSGIDWANAEALAFASLLKENIPIRLSGQDSGRGTFSQRHSVLVDINSGAFHVPLNALGTPQADFSVYNSMLSESGILGFEYGYALAQPNVLTLWEAQFGDFANNAQSIIDLYIASGESKWQRLCGLVLLLPHGYEGLGPEHSSARLERFLQLCAEDNLQVCNPTTPSQYFHLLRRQVKRSLRKPLVVMTPKSLLRHPAVVSDIQDLSDGVFHEVLDDPHNIKKPRCVLFCSGKIYYELIQKREALSASDTAIIRIEQFYPFPEALLRKRIQKYSAVKKYRWVQEEPENMGAWNFLRNRLEPLLSKPLEFAGRDASASTATGFPNLYRQQQAALLDAAFAA